MINVTCSDVHRSFNSSLEPQRCVYAGSSLPPGSCQAVGARRRQRNSDKSTGIDNADRRVSMRVSLSSQADRSSSFVCQGKDRVALLYASQLNTLRLNLYHKIRLARKTAFSEYDSPEYQRSWSYAAWASFKIEVSVV